MPHKQKDNEQKKSEEQPKDEKKVTHEIPKEKPITSENDKITQLEETLSKAKQEAEENFKRLQRSVADFQNLKKQTEAEKMEFAKFANASLILSLLEVCDDLERAIGTTPEDIVKTEWYKGILLVRQNFYKKLEQEGLKRIETKGQKFDPNFHEALLYQESSEIQPEHILSEAKTGYILGNKVIRHSQVIVSKGK